MSFIKWSHSFHYEYCSDLGGGEERFFEIWFTHSPKPFSWFDSFITELYSNDCENCSTTASFHHLASITHEVDFCSYLAIANIWLSTNTTPFVCQY